MADEILRSALRAGPDCLPVEVLSERIDLDSQNPLRLALDAHLQSCPHCQAEIELLREFESGTVRPDEKAHVRWIVDRLAAPAAKESWWRHWRVPRLGLALGSAAAVALLLIGVVAELPRGPRSSRPVPEFDERTQRSASIELTQTPGGLEWKPVAGTSRYEVIVRTVGDQIVFDNFLTQPALAFPPELAELVTTGRVLRAEIVARDSAGNTIAKSGMQRLNQARR